MSTLLAYMCGEHGSKHGEVYAVQYVDDETGKMILQSLANRARVLIAKSSECQFLGTVDAVSLSQCKLL